MSITVLFPLISGDNSNYDYENVGVKFLQIRGTAGYRTTITNMKAILVSSPGTSFQNGYDNGYDDGYAVGYNKGLNIGQEMNLENASGFEIISSGIGKTFEALDVEIFWGKVSVLDILTFMMAIGLTFGILRVLRG